jgi:hypothetical protein
VVGGEADFASDCTVSKCHLSSGRQFPLITVPESDFYIFQASAEEERVCIATDLSATLSKLHRDDYVGGCLAPAEVPISMATLHEFVCHSRHKANDDLLGYCKTLRFG